jgi:hypothetical protein
MRPVTAAAFLGTGVVAVALLGIPHIVIAPAAAHAAPLYAPETLDRYFRLEWSKNGRTINGYVYNSSNRRASRMQLLVEGRDASGAVVTKSTTWVRDVPPNNRAYFEVSVPTAASYRVSVLSFDWIEDGDRLDRRKGW